MYPRSKFQEILLEIRQEMAREADFDVDLFAEIVRTGAGPRDPKVHRLLDQHENNSANGKGDLKQARKSSK